MDTPRSTPTTVDRSRPVLRPGQVWQVLAWLLTACTVAATVATVWAGEVLLGPAVMNGSAKGTALVMLFAGLPLLAASTALAARGSARAVILALGAISYLGYNAVMLLLGTPFNSVFLLYEAVLGLSIWSAAALVSRVDADAVADRYPAALRVRWISVFVWSVVGLNALAWLRGIVPGMLDPQSPDFLVGTGLTTLPTYIQDLAFWLPMFAVAAWWLWRGEAWGYVAVPALLTYFVLEAVGVAADQALGHAADPSSPVASAGAVPMFLAVAVISAVPLLHLLGSLRQPT